MCGRYVRRGSLERVGAQFSVEPEDFPADLPEGGVPQFAPSFNVAPQTIQPVVVLDRETGRRQVHAMRWGLIPFWAKDASIGARTINARAEGIETKAAFRESLKQRRCLVPADLFYEWKKLPGSGKTLKKQPYAIGLAGSGAGAEESGPMMAFAGLWDRWKAPDGQRLETFTIVTTDPNALMEGLHDRMPAVLAPADWERWLTPGDPARLPLDLLRPFPAEKMTAWPVSAAVGNVRNDRPDLIARCAEDGPEAPADGKLWT